MKYSVMPSLSEKFFVLQYDYVKTHIITLVTVTTQVTLRFIYNNNNFIFDIAPILTVLSALQQSMKHSKINVRVKNINTKNFEPKRL